MRLNRTYTCFSCDRCGFSDTFDSDDAAEAAGWRVIKENCTLQHLLDKTSDMGPVCIRDFEILMRPRQDISAPLVPDAADQEAKAPKPKGAYRD